ncbi:hypothetical protein Taro_005159, partial [Colocasia esculenta]|nr:hypothetical protein [Colocasia esculenta]
SSPRLVGKISLLALLISGAAIDEREPLCKGSRHSLKEVLDAPGIMSLIKDTKAAQEVRALKDFFSMLSNVSSIL